MFLFSPRTALLEDHPHLRLGGSEASLSVGQVEDGRGGTLVLAVYFSSLFIGGSFGWQSLAMVS